MCLFILLNMSLVPAIVSLVVLGLGLIFILTTLLTYFATWQRSTSNSARGKSSTSHASMYHPVDVIHLCEDEIDLAKADELSTLV